MAFERPPEGDLLVLRKSEHRCLRRNGSFLHEGSCIVRDKRGTSGRSATKKGPWQSDTSISRFTALIFLMGLPARRGKAAQE